MFQRALKVKFNEQKYLHTSIVRLMRNENQYIQSSGKRLGLVVGFFFLPVIIRWYRKSGTHKVCYTPLRKGLHQLKNDPYHQALAKGEVYGVHPGPKGRATFP